MVTKSFKLSEETAKRLEAVLEEMKQSEQGVSWEDCMDALASSYEMQKTAQGADRQADARDFRATINRAVDLYIAALAAIPAAQDRARAESEKAINASNAAATALYVKIEELEKQLADYENLKERASRADALQREIEGLSQKHANEIDILKREHAAELREAIATEREKYAEQLTTKFSGKFSG